MNSIALAMVLFHSLFATIVVGDECGKGCDTTNDCEKYATDERFSACKGTECKDGKCKPADDIQQCGILCDGPPPGTETNDNGNGEASFGASTAPNLCCEAVCEQLTGIENGMCREICKRLPTLGADSFKRICVLIPRQIIFKVARKVCDLVIAACIR